MQEDFLQLEKKYFQKFTPLYEKRAKIVNGSSEPSEDEIQVGQEAQQSLRLDGASETTTATGASGGNSSTNTSKGIPEFWLSAMKNQVSLAEMITDRDEVALKYLEDINMEYLDRPGFQLNFDFADNEYFSNRRLSKTYYYQEQTGYGGDFIYDHAVGTPVNWKPGRDLTVKIESKKQRNKSKVVVRYCVQLANRVDTKQTRVIRKSVPTESFFTFFSPPVPPDKEKYEDGDIEQRLELDYQLGEDIKEKLIPRAIDWFTGEALQYEQPDEEYDENDSEEEGSEDTDDLSDDGEETEESDGPVSVNFACPSGLFVPGHY